MWEQVIDGVAVIVPPVCDVPAGEFLMGSDPAADKQLFAAEEPRHAVTLAAYRIGRYPVTVAEYACFVRAGQRVPPTWQLQIGELDHPAVYISWGDAAAYAAWLTRVTGQAWRLPTEAEWEKAARWDPAARHPHIYPWGDAFDQARCNTSGSGTGSTTPVGAYVDRGDASPCGAHDLAGNVWEWASSIFMPYPYRADDGRERARATGDRVRRGGSWFNEPQIARAAYRNFNPPRIRGGNVGFRVVMAAPSA